MNEESLNKRKELMRREGKRLINAGVLGKAFPGGASALAFRRDGQMHIVDFAAGATSPDISNASPTTLYDLASLTKPFVATCALRAKELAKLDLQAPAESILTDVRNGVADGATVEQLFTHRAPIASWGGLYLDVPHDPGSPAARRWILNEATRRPDLRPDGRAKYSDLGYIIAGAVVERAMGQSLDKILREQVTDPLDITTKVFYCGAPPSGIQGRLARDSAPTERDEWRGQMLQGDVHDQNAAALGGVAGHAGLFGTASGVARFGLAMLDALSGDESILSKPSIEYALKPRDGGSLVFGWDRKSEKDSSAGSKMSANSFGHLGFTGTSVWCDPDRKLAVVLLTNRVHPSRANERIKGFRPRFHDGMVTAFDKLFGPNAIEM